MSRVDTALIDGDIVVYRSGFSAQHDIHTLSFEDDMGEAQFVYESKRELNAFIKEKELEDYEISTRTEVEPLANALHTVKKTIGTILEQTRAADFKVFLSKGENFRHRNATILKYKGNRDDLRRPVHYDDIRKYIIKYYDAIVCEDIEADDALANYQTDTTVICSIDKDLLQVPGKHFNWVHASADDDRTGKILISPPIGLQKLWMQVLTGDATDNIPGIKGIGDVKAKRALADCTTAEEYCFACIEKWNEYLLSDKAPEWVVGADTEEESIVYKHWDTGEEIRATAEDIVNEVYSLLKVGT